MVPLLILLAASYGALLIWLTVRIVNRRERWAIWTAGGLFAAFVIAAFAGPAILFFVRFLTGQYENG